MGRRATLVLTLAVLGACDPNPDEHFVGQPRVFSHVDVVAAFPARRAADGSWARACGDAAADGVLLSTVLVSTVPPGYPQDRDLSIRPGDVLARGPMVAPAATSGLDVALDCRTALGPDAPACEPVHATMTDLRYAARTPARAAGHDLVLLIDASGSIDGLVDPARAYREADPTRLIPPASFGSLASDRADLRLVAARTFIASLGPDDRVCVLGFGEAVGDGAGIVAIGDAATTCFAPGLVEAYPASSLALLGSAAGRSPLWAAVDAAVGLFDALPASTRSRDVVVLTDGPDTCAPGAELDACAAPCSDVTADDVRARLESRPELRLHLVQFEAKGYRGPDPRQVDLACRSGGHYRFVNSEAFDKYPVALAESLDQALLGVRFALMGEWQAGLAVGAGAPGRLAGLSGVVRVHPASRLVGAERDFVFGIGIGVGAASASAWDRRPLLLTPCASDAACAAADALLATCSPETHLCGAPVGPAPACPD